MGRTASLKTRVLESHIDVMALLMEMRPRETASKALALLRQANQMIEGGDLIGESAERTNQGVLVLADILEIPRRDDSLLAG